jgi:hypothetical protein
VDRDDADLDADEIRVSVDLVIAPNPPTLAVVVKATVDVAGLIAILQAFPGDLPVGCYGLLRQRKRKRWDTWFQRHLRADRQAEQRRVDR